MRFYTIVQFYSVNSIRMDFGRSLGSRGLRSYDSLKAARNQRTQQANRLKSSDLPHDVRILCVEVWGDGEVKHSWVQ